MEIDRRSFVAGAGAAGLAFPGAAAAAQRTYTPEMFGAKGDGTTNDSKALALMAQTVSANGGGIVEFRPVTYLVGAQAPSLARGSLYAFEPAKLMEFVGCSGPLLLRGNGAHIRCADGLRYGVFDAAGDPVSHPMPYLGPGVASPYRTMIRIERCSGPVEISGLELDGNLPRLRIGGEYGDTGRQIPTTGLLLIDNRGDEIVRDVHSHHHAMDGMAIDGIAEPIAPPPRRLITAVTCDYNGRQGCSITGGRGYAFRNCKFNHTGRSVIESAPAAGVDIEAEGGKTNRDHSFTDCEFSNNVGCGMVADSGDSEGGTFTRCTFVGTTAWSAWPRKPFFQFHDCRFVGALVRAYGDPDPRRAAQFHDCLFTDDPRLSATGKVYLGGRANYPIADLSDAHNVLFARCTFTLTHGGLLPWSWFALYQDCRMSQKTTVQGYPKGKYLGTSIIAGNVDLFGTQVIGVVTVNGRRIEHTQLGGKSW